MAKKRRLVVFSFTEHSADWNVTTRRMRADGHLDADGWWTDDGLRHHLERDADLSDVAVILLQDQGPATAEEDD